MKELIEKLTTYNIFNHLLPGALFAVFAERITAHKVVQADLVTGLFLYYFIGMVISRVGSLCIEPIAKRFKLVTFVDYSDFVKASKADTKLEPLSEANNTYRTMCSLFATLIALKLYDVLSVQLGIPNSGNVYIMLVSLFALFALSFRKQSQYIVKRVGSTNETHC
jgi:hypothetical protein